MNKQEIYDLLQEKGLWFEVTEHPAVYNMAELAEIPLPYPEADAKNLFVRDDKKRNYYLITVKGDKRVDLKAFRAARQTRPLSFASADDLLRLLALTPGSVTPLGLLNDETRTVQLFLDEDLCKSGGLVGVHPNDNTATVWMRSRDLIALIEAHGSPVRVIPL